MKTITKAAVMVILAGLGAGCGPLQSGDTGSPERIHSLDGVKLISPAYPQIEDPRTMLQTTYNLNANSRLLLRFEELSQYIDEIQVGNGLKVEIQVTATPDTLPASAQANLQLCPITRNWMESSNWLFAHPYSQGRWGTPGGDYEADACAAAFQLNGSDLLFDVTHWFVNFPRGRGVNYGLILMTTASVAVYGEQSGISSPRIIWTANH